MSKTRFKSQPPSRRSARVRRTCLRSSSRVSATGGEVPLNLLAHAHDGHGSAVFERDFDSFKFRIPFGPVEGNSGQGGPHLQAGEAGGTDGGFASFPDKAPHPVPPPIRVNEETANAGPLRLVDEQLL